MSKITSKVSDLASNVEKFVLENKIALGIKKLYYEYALIQKEKWRNFITDSKKTKEPCDVKILAACFDIMGSLPMKREIKHDLASLSAKILECQINLGLDPNFD